MDKLLTANKFEDVFRNKNVLITGGMGFIGSNLAIKLMKAGANVLITDAMIEGYGGNLFNIDPIKDKVTVNYCDIRDQSSMDYLVQNKDYIFLSAAQVCHIKSLTDPFMDIDINIKGTAVILEALRKHNQDAVVVKMGSRGQYGSVLKLPVSEDVKPEPKGIYEISLLAAEHILSSYYRIHGIKSIMLRLTNIYGPRAQMKHSRFGVANWFIRLALDNEVIPIFGDGSIKRDFLYIDDCIEAILLAATRPKAVGQVLNVGRDDPSTFFELAQIIIKELGSGEYKFKPFSPERKAQEPGDFYSDITKIECFTGWRPSTSLKEGVRKTIQYYQRHREKYW